MYCDETDDNLLPPLSSETFCRMFPPNVTFDDYVNADNNLLTSDIPPAEAMIEAGKSSVVSDQ